MILTPELPELRWLLLLVSCCWLLWKYPIRYYMSVLNHLPGPPATSWLTGAHADLVDWYQVPGGFPKPIIPWMETYGGIVRYRGYGFSHRLLVSDPDAVKHLLVKNASNYPRSPLLLKIVTEIAGEAGLFGTEGAAHLKQRKMLNPHFSLSHIKEFSDVFQLHADVLIKQFDTFIAKGNSEIQLDQKFTDMALDIIGITAFGFKFDSLYQSGNKVKQAYQTLMAKNSSLKTLALAFIPGFRHFPIESIWKRKQAMKVINEAVENIIYAKLNQKNQTYVKKDLLDLMLDGMVAENNNSTNKEQINEIKSHVLTFLAGGHETTSNTFSWFIALISQHPEAQMKARQECQRLMKELDCEIITIGNISQLQFLNACIQETLRLYPSVAFVATRRALQDDVLPTISGDKIQVPAGTDILVSLIGLQRNPKYWTQPQEFLPERFLEGSALYEKDAKLRRGRSRSFFYMPFSTGSKNCIGSRFAMAQLNVILSNLLSRFSFELSKNANVCPEMRNIVVAPKDLKVSISRVA